MTSLHWFDQNIRGPGFSGISLLEDITSQKHQNEAYGREKMWTRKKLSLESEMRKLERLFIW